MCSFWLTRVDHISSLSVGRVDPHHHHHPPTRLTPHHLLKINHPLQPRQRFWSALVPVLGSFAVNEDTAEQRQGFEPGLTANRRSSSGSWMSWNPFSLGLSIRSCRGPNALPRCHYWSITPQIPQFITTIGECQALLMAAGERAY